MPVVHEFRKKLEDSPEGDFLNSGLYNNKIVYKMQIEIVYFHHCILNIKGENDEE